LRVFATVVKEQEKKKSEARAVLVLAGDGPLRVKLELEAKILQIDRYVRFAGFQVDVRPFYRLADATLLVSLQEGLPRSLMESLAMETPVITTDVRGNHEVADETCGLLVPPMDVEALASALRKMLGMTAERRREMGRQGRAKMSAFSQEKCLELTERVYARLACQSM
jgi:glycosyltransferase involved in cell wall biosynthesis